MLSLHFIILRGVIMKQKINRFLQQLGKSLLVPIGLLPIAGILISVGSYFTGNIFSSYTILQSGSFLNQFMVIMVRVGKLIFELLPLLFAIAIAFGLSHKEKETAAFSATIAYLVMNVTVATLIEMNPSASDSELLRTGIKTILGVKCLDTGFFGGVLIGIVTSQLHNRFYKIEFIEALNFFGGTRFIPIISSLVAIVLGWLIFLVWPYLFSLLFQLGLLISNLGYVGTLLFGLIKRSLIPLGLHHVFYMPFWQGVLGGTMEVGGELIHGGQNIIFAQLATESAGHLSVEASRFFSGEYIFMIFGLPGAALALYHSADKSQKDKVRSRYMSAALVCISLGVTEPIEFMFMLVAPVLYTLHIIYSALAYMIAHILNIAVGITFSGGLLDLFFYGILPGNDRTSWILIPLVGIIYFILYYLTFRFIVNKQDIKTLGRIQNESNDEDKDSMISTILKGLGGKDNIVDIGNCATRLRIYVKDESLIDEGILNKSNALGVMIQEQNIQLIFGPKVATIKTEIDEYLQNN